MVILVLGNSDAGIYNFRKELLQTLCEQEHKVFTSVTTGICTQNLTDMGCNTIYTPIERRSLNPFKDLKLLRQYRRIIKNVKPDVVLTYTIKPNIYGGLICRMHKIPYIANITGLGTTLNKQGLLQSFILLLYKAALKKAQKIFFQNQVNLDYLIRKKIPAQKCVLIPGSGVNINYYIPQPYPPDDTIGFTYIGRVMKEKGIEEYLTAVQVIKTKYPNTDFHICGRCEEDFKAQLEELHQRGLIIFNGIVDSTHEILGKTHCTIHPSHHEGMSNVILESAACARPVIATDIPGCREAVEDGVSGYLFPKGDGDALVTQIERFLALTWEQKRDMGIKGRRKMEREFDRQIVVDAYMREIEAPQV